MRAPRATVALVLAALVLGAPAPALARHLRPPRTPAELARDLRLGAALRRVPAHLHPALAGAARAEPVIFANGCHLGREGLASRPCVYGDTGSPTSVVLFGDSHAAAWFPGLEVVARAHHWRLLDFTKAGCPPVDVAIAAWFRHGAPYGECATWRADAEYRIAALHPAVVLVAWARYVEAPEAEPLDGVPGGLGGPWPDGVASLFARLRAAAGRTVFLSDVPTLRRSAPACLAAHRADARRCATARRRAVRLPGVKARELALARGGGAAAIDPTSWFCARSVCPAVVGDVLLYRDNAHMVPDWSRFLAPVLDGALTSALGPG
jgi:hypothetical protein